MTQNLPQPPALDEILERARNALAMRPATKSGQRFAVPKTGRNDSEEPGIDVDTKRGIIGGYASVYNVWDSYNTRFLPGVFSDSIKARHQHYIDQGKPTRIKFLWQHKHDEPLGVPVTFREEEYGLFAEARVCEPDSGLGKRALTLADEGVVEGLSVGFDIDWDGVRILTAEEAVEEGFDLDDPWVQFFWPMEFSKLNLSEYSQVTFPGVDDARITEVTRSLERTLIPGWRPNPEGIYIMQRNTPPASAPAAPSAPSKRMDPPEIDNPEEEEFTDETQDQDERMGAPCDDESEGEDRQLRASTLRTLRTSLMRMVDDIDEALRMDEEDDESASDEPETSDPDADADPEDKADDEDQNQRSTPTKLGFLSQLRGAVQNTSRSTQSSTAQ